jgi:glutamyl-tRNA reductase
VLGAGEVAAAIERRRHRPFCFVDISVPRQIDPEVGELDGVFLFDMDDLQSVVASNLREREREATAAETIVDDEVTKFFERAGATRIGPTVAELKSHLNEVALAELDRLRRKLGDLTPEQEGAIREILLPSIINKISHPMIAHMRDSATGGEDVDESISIWRRVFRLGQDRD